MPPKGLNPKQKRILLIGGGGALLALMFFLSRGTSAAQPQAPVADPGTAATFAPPSDSGGGGADLSQLMSDVSQLGAGQQQLADAIVGGQGQLVDLIGGLQLGGAAAPAAAPAPTTTSVAPVPGVGAHNQPAAKPEQRAPSQIHLRVADARAAAPAQVKSTPNSKIAALARAHPNWGPHALAAGHVVKGHSERF